MKFVPINQTRLQEMTGADVVVLDTVTSTNDYIEGLLRAQFVEGLLVVAEEQTAGKGRIEGRRFFSPSGYGIYMSMAVNEPVGQKMFKLFTVHPAVIFRYINDRHNNYSFRDSEFYFSILDIVCTDTRHIPCRPLRFQDEHWQMKYQYQTPWRQ